jgi:zinc protease
MFFKASKEYPQPDAFIDRAAELGAVFNGTTQEERVNYYLTLPADSLEGGMRFVAAALRAPLFRQDELERERQVVLGEYDRNESNPGFELQNEMTKRLYPGNYSRKNTIGDREVIRTVTPEKMREIQRKYYVPNNCALLVTGDVNPARVFALAEQIYGDWPRGPDPFKADPIPAIPDLTKNDAVVSEAPVSAVSVLMQWQGPSVRKDAASTYAADVFSDALNTPGSGFQRRLVDSGLWQGVVVNYYTLDQKGPITISGQTSPERLREALAALEAEIEKLDDPGYFTAAELPTSRHSARWRRPSASSGRPGSRTPSASGGRWRTWTTSWDTWTTWRRRRRRTCSGTRRATSSASRTSRACSSPLRLVRRSGSRRRS